MRLRFALGCVALVMTTACVSVGSPPASPGATDASSDPGSSSNPSPASSQAAAPPSLRADQPRVWKADPKSWSVVLTWGQPPGFEADHYEIRRNGRTVDDHLPGTRFVDQDVDPRTAYEYEVTGVDAGGVRTGRASVHVETNAPPVADARLDGRFAMKMHITGQTGLQGGASGGGMLFLYDPVCASGPCDVTWSRTGRPGSGRLDRDDARYSGTVSAPFQIGSCHGGTVTETLVFTTKVLEANAIRGAWRATKIEGTLHESAPASGCVTATIDWSFTGFVQT